MQTPGMALKCCGMYLNHLKLNPDDKILAVAGAKNSPTIVVGMLQQSTRRIVLIFMLGGREWGMGCHVSSFDELMFRAMCREML